MRTHRAVVGRRFRSITKLTTKVRIGRGYLWGSFLIAAAALKTPTRSGYNAQGVNLKMQVGGRNERRFDSCTHDLNEVNEYLVKANSETTATLGVRVLLRPTVSCVYSGEVVLLDYMKAASS